jgi:hypothetical protein
VKKDFVENGVDHLFEQLPEWLQQAIFEGLAIMFKVYYTIIHQFPYNKAKHRLAYHAKYIGSEQYLELKRSFGTNAARNLYFEWRLWKEYEKKLDVYEKLKCFFLPYSVINFYGG